jgi:hypothetical protein
MIVQHVGCCDRDDSHYHEDELMAWLAAERAERYAALVSEYGEADTNAMLMFPWTPPIPKEPRTL